LTTRLGDDRGLWMSVESARDFREKILTLASHPAPLQGTLKRPVQTNARAAAILILAGSGPVDWDGNLPQARSDNLKLLAHGLARRGVSTLRIDKRGVAASRVAGPSEADLGFTTYVDDALAWLDRLAGETGIPRIGIVGHSEGALVGMLAAQRRPSLSRLVLVAGAGFPVGQLIRRQLAAASIPQPLRDAAERVLAALEAGRRVEDVPPDLAALFRPSVQPYLISRLPLDSAEELKRVGIPTLIVQGTTDLQVAERDARALAAARPDAELVLIDGMNHVLKQAPLDQSANAATYRDPTLPLAPGLIERITDFLTR
jgi:pimeloyl-ACP methyl ester carboxylesterase